MRAVAAMGVLLLVSCAPLAAQGETSRVVSCPPGAGPGLTGLAGFVRDTVQDVLLPGARVEATWRDEKDRSREASVIADKHGSYLLCGLPPLTPVSVRATFSSLASEPTLLTIEPGMPAGWDIPFGVEAGVVVKVLREPGRILGRVVDGNSDRPVEAAAITLSDTLRVDDTRQRLSDGSGRFLFADLQPGAYRFRVEHLAYESVDQTLQLPSDRTLQVDVALTVDPIELEPIVVTAVREKALEVRGFYERKEIAELVGRGIFVTRTDLRQTAVVRTTQYLGRLPGVRTECPRGPNHCTIRMHRGTPRLGDVSTGWGCVSPNVWVDGVRVLGEGRGGSIDHFVSPVEIAGIEVYRSPAELPAEFGGSIGRCGAIVIWTGPADAPS